MQLPENSNILIISHFSKRAIEGGGPPQEVRDYLLPKVKRLYYIEHPFPYAKDHRSSMAIYEDGILRKQIFTPLIFGPEALFYILDTFITFYFLIIARVRFDLCIALDNLNTVSIFPFRKLRIVKKLVFYTIDYTPQRFKNPLLNHMYYLIDKIACYNADAVWISTKKVIETRKKNAVDMKKSAPHIVLPFGANLSRIKIMPIEKINRYQLIFVGFLAKNHGVQLVLQALPSIIKPFPFVKFIIIGDGEYTLSLKTMTRDLGLEKHVVFKGFVKDFEVVEKIACCSAIALATYLPSPDTLALYGDPGKPKLYLGCGLPVIVTRVPEIASIIDKKEAGFIIDYNPKSAADALVKLLSDEKLYARYRENAIKLSKNYDTNTLIAEALDKTN